MVYCSVAPPSENTAHIRTQARLITIAAEEVPTTGQTYGGGRQSAQAGVARRATVGSEAAKYNPYSGKIVVMDEAHHLTRPHRLFKFQLDNLRAT